MQKLFSPKNKLIVVLLVVAACAIAGTGSLLLSGSKAAGTSDINGDSKTDVFDLSILLSKWGQSSAGASDINGDGTVNVFDLSILLSAWGQGGVTQTTNCAPAANATMTNTVSHLCGFPDTTNTGPAVGTVFKRVPQDITQADATTGSGWHFDNRGWIVVDTNGGVIKNIDTTYTINVQADNVTVMNNRLTLNGDEFGIALLHTTNSIIKNNLVSGANSGSGRVVAAIKSIYGDDINPQMIANNIVYSSTGIQFDSGLIEGNYIHDMGFQEGDHTNGTTAGGGDDSQLTIRNNTVFNQLSQTDAISLFQDFGNQTNTTIDNNLIAGGSYCIYGGGGSQLSSNIKITNNQFSRIFFPNCGYYGPMAYWQSNGPGNIASGNIWDDTGQPLNL